MVDNVEQQQELTPMVMQMNTSTREGAGKSPTKHGSNTGLAGLGYSERDGRARILEESGQICF